jgi:hypothetical protein
VIYKPPLAQEHSETSKDAARKIERPRRILRERVLWYIDIRADLGATDEEIQDALGMNPSTERPRRIELVEAGLVRDSGETRRTKAGRRAAIWVAT